MSNDLHALLNRTAAEVLSRWFVDLPTIRSSDRSHRVREARKAVARRLAELEVDGTPLLSHEDIATYIGRDRTTVLYLLGLTSKTDSTGMATESICRALDLSVRASQVLESAGVLTLRDVVTKTEQEIRLLPGMGATSFREIERRLQERHLAFGMTPGQLHIALSRQASRKPARAGK